MNLAGFSSPVASWPDFTQRVSGLEVQARGRPFELVVQHYLRSDPAYRTKLRHVWLLSDVPDAIHKQLGLPHLDQGIDLIAETHTGEFWAIQAKYRTDTEAALTHRELATFTSLAFTVCRDISYGLVCTTTSRIPGILTGLPNLGDLTNEVWSGLGPKFFSSLQETIATGSLPARPKARVPQPHQERAIASAIVHYHDKGETRGKLISPCGSGKSLTACWIAQKLEAKRVLIAVPSIALIRQTLETWMHEALARDEPADWLCVCSDHDAAKTEKAELVAHVHELGIPCDTHPEALARHLSALRGQSGQIVVITTYQSSPVLAAAAKAAGFSFDFAVLDEAHRTTGQKAKSFAHLLFDENLALPRRLFMTATERRFQGSSDEVVSMDDPALYGSTFELLSFKAAIAASPPILSDYRILTIGVRESEVARLVEANRWLALGAEGLDEVTAQALASLVALPRATTEHSVQHTVSFHSSIARAKQFRDLCSRLNTALPDEKPIASHHVNGGMGSAARQRELSAFLTTAPSLITNARCLTEGVDVPRIDCVFFADPKGSTIEIVQAAGRALRLAQGKAMGFILLPLVVKDGATLDEVTETSAFKFVLFVLRALATHDDRIIDWFRAASEGRTPEVGGLVHFDFGQVVAPLGVNAADFAKQIEARCWEIIGKLSYASYEMAQAWARELGIKSGRAWGIAYRRMSESKTWPVDIPRAVDSYYRGKGWIDWPSFLGVGEKYVRYIKGLAGRPFRSFEEAREWAQSLHLSSLRGWMSFVRENHSNLPSDIPSWPDRTYRGKGWKGWPDFLGYFEDWRSFDEARAFARSLDFNGQREWKRYAKGARPDIPPKPSDIPASPWKAYENLGWQSWPDWLGTGKLGRDKNPSTLPKKSLTLSKPRPSKFRDFQSARNFVQALQLESSTQWYVYVKGLRPDKGMKPADIPSSPHSVYASQWISRGDWIGRPDNIAPFRKEFRSFEEARTFARSLGLRKRSDWELWCHVSGNRPPYIPSRPSHTYKAQGFIGWADFLQPPTDV